MQTDNYTTYGVVSNKIIRKATKAMYISFTGPEIANSNNNSNFIREQ